MSRKRRRDDLPREDAGRVGQARLQARARREFLTQVPLLTSVEIASLLGSSGEQRPTTPDRLKREGKLFAIPHRGADRFPAFQIADGEPHPAIEDIVRAFDGAGPWTVALWFHAPSGWLGGERPMDALQHAPERVVDAARKAVPSDWPF